MDKRIRALNVENALLNLLKFGVILYIAGFFLLPSSKQNTLLYLTVFSPWLLLLPYNFKNLVPKHIVAHMLGIGIIYYCVSSFWSSDPGESFSKATKYGLYIFAFISSIHLLFKDKKISLNIIFVVIFLAALVSGVITLIFQWASITDGRLTHSLLTSISTNPINTAVFFGVSCLIAVHFLRVTENSLYRGGALIAFLFFFVLIILTKSRGPIAALIITLPLMFVFIKGRSKTADYLMIGMTLIFIMMLALLLSENIGQRIEQPDYRLEIWSVAFDEFRRNIMFGTGLNFNDRITLPSGLVFTHSHNSFIQFFVTGGVVGASIFMGVILYVFTIAIRSQNSLIKLCGLWFLFGCICLATNGKLLIYKPSSIWFSFWVPLSLILYSHISSMEDTKYKYFASLTHHLRWQKGYSKARWILNTTSGLWMSFLSWIVLKIYPETEVEACDILVLSRRENSHKDNLLVELLSKRYDVKTDFQVKRPQVIKRRLVARVPWLVPASLYLHASYACFLVYKYRPKIIITAANGSVFSPFLRLAMNDSGGCVVHIAHSIPTDNYRTFSLIDVDYYFVYGRSSIDKLKHRENLFGVAKCIETGSWVIDEQLNTLEKKDTNISEKAILLLGSGPNVELREGTERIYKLTIDWVLEHPEFKLYFKPHPRSNCELWARLMSDLKDSSRFEKTNRLDATLSHCYAAIAAFTNAVLDVSLIGIPPLWIATKNDSDEFSYEEFFGKRTFDEKQLSENLTAYIENSDSYKEKTVLFANYHINQHKEGATEFMVKNIEQIMLGNGESIEGVLVGTHKSSEI